MNQTTNLWRFPLMSRYNWNYNLEIKLEIYQNSVKIRFIVQGQNKMEVLLSTSYTSEERFGSELVRGRRTL